MYVIVGIRNSRYIQWKFCADSQAAIPGKHEENFGSHALILFQSISYMDIGVERLICVIIQVLHWFINSINSFIAHKCLWSVITINSNSVFQFNTYFIFFSGPEVFLILQYEYVNIYLIFYIYIIPQYHMSFWMPKRRLSTMCNVWPNPIWFVTAT